MIRTLVFTNFSVTTQLRHFDHYSYISRNYCLLFPNDKRPLGHSNNSYLIAATILPSAPFSLPQSSLLLISSLRMMHASLSLATQIPDVHWLESPIPPFLASRGQEIKLHPTQDFHSAIFLFMLGLQRLALDGIRQIAKGFKQTRRS